MRQPCEHSWRYATIKISLKKQGIGKGVSFSINEEIRKDSILWIEETSSSPILASYSSHIDGLISLLNRHFFFAT